MLREREIQTIFDEHFPKQTIPSPIALRIKQQISQRNSMAASAQTIQDLNNVSSREAQQSTPKNINGVLFSQNIPANHKSETVSAPKQGRAYLWPHLEQVASVAVASATVILLVFFSSFVEFELPNNTSVAQPDQNTDETTSVAMLPEATTQPTIAVDEEILSTDRQESQTKIIRSTPDLINPFPSGISDGKAIAMILTPTPWPTATPATIATVAVQDSVAVNDEPAPTSTTSATPTAVPVTILSTVTPMAIALNGAAPSLIQNGQGAKLPTPNPNLAQEDIVLVPTSIANVTASQPTVQPQEPAIVNSTPTPVSATNLSAAGGVIGRGPVVPDGLAANSATAVAQGVYLPPTVVPTPIPQVAPPNAVPTLLPPHAISPTPTSWSSPTPLPTATSTQTLIPTSTPLFIQPTSTPIPTYTWIPPTATSTSVPSQSQQVSVVAPTATPVPPTPIPTPTHTWVPPTAVPTAIPTSAPSQSQPSVSAPTPMPTNTPLPPVPQPTATPQPPSPPSPTPQPPTPTPRRESSNNNSSSAPPPTATPLPPTPIPPPTATPVPPAPTATPYLPTNTPIPTAPPPTNTPIIIDVDIIPGVPDNTPIPTVPPLQPTSTPDNERLGNRPGDATPTYGPTPTSKPKPTNTMIVIAPTPTPAPTSTVAPTEPPALPTAQLGPKATDTPRPVKVIVDADDCESDLACISDKPLPSEEK